jgi:hypothetical protein
MYLSDLSLKCMHITLRVCVCFTFLASRWSMSTEYEEDAVHSLIREEALCREPISCAFMIQLMVLYTEQYEEGTADRTSQAFCYLVTKAAGKHRTNTSADLPSETLQRQHIGCALIQLRILMHICRARTRWLLSPDAAFSGHLQYNARCAPSACAQMTCVHQR